MPVGFGSDVPSPSAEQSHGQPPQPGTAAGLARAADYVAARPCDYQGQIVRPWPDVVEDVRRQVQAAIDDDRAFIASG